MARTRLTALRNLVHPPCKPFIGARTLSQRDPDKAAAFLHAKAVSGDRQLKCKRVTVWYGCDEYRNAVRHLEYERCGSAGIKPWQAEANSTHDGCRQLGGESGVRECAMLTRSVHVAPATMLLSFAIIWPAETTSAQMPPADDAEWTECVKSKDPDRVIASCTAVISRGDRRAAVAYSLRGGAYSHKGDQDQAIRDLDQAIALKPGFPAAYDARGIA